MRTIPVLLYLFALILPQCVCGQTPPGSVPEVDAIRGPYQQRLAAIKAARDARVKTVTHSYLGTLDRLQSDFTVHGDLNSALLVKGEKERAAGNQDPSAADRKAMPPQLVAARQAYEKDRAPLLAAARQDQQALLRDYLATLDALQNRFTTTNQLDKAVAAKNEKERASADTEDADAAVAAPPAGQVASTGPKVISTTGTLDATLAEKISAAVKAKSSTQTETSGKPGGWPDVPGRGALLVGFEFFNEESFGAPDVRSLRPIFLTKDGTVEGSARGEMKKVTEKVLAHPGYAVAGLETYQNPMRIQGIQVTFMKIDPATGRFDPSPSNAYKSKWYGTRGKGRPKVLGGDGRLVIGIFGVSGADADAIGLVQMP